MAEPRLASPHPLRSPRRWAGFITTIGAFMLLLGLLPIDSATPDDMQVGHWSSALPPLVAIAFAFWFRALVTALAIGVGVGALLHFGFNPFVSIPLGIEAFLWQEVSDGFQLRIIAFTVVLVGMVRIMSRSGGNAGIVDWITARARGLRSTRLAAAFMGLVFFFDDYANTVVVGTTMRPLTDRLRIAREKLAWIVDSTAAPIAGLALISTWVAMEVGLFAEISESEGLGIEGYAFLLAVLPLRFYCFSALFFVFSGAAMSRDFGPMLKAERRARRTGQVSAPDAQPLLEMSSIDEVLPEGTIRLARNAVIPIVAVVGGVLAATLFLGRADIVAAGVPIAPWSFDAWRIGFSEADSSLVLLLAALFAVVIASALALTGPSRVPPRQIGGAFMRGAWSMRLAITILIFAWAIKAVCDALGTSGFLIAAIGSDLPLVWLPLLTFLLSGLVAFATGTSWGTMAIVLPVVLPVAIAMGASLETAPMLLFLTGAAVLDGAIFGDHCSPISDTTVLSSAATGCDHLHHVRTQAPYALMAMLLAGTFGYTAVAFGLSPLVAILLIGLSSVALFRFVGRPIDVDIEDDAPHALAAAPTEASASGGTPPVGSAHSGAP